MCRAEVAPILLSAIADALTLIGAPGCSRKAGVTGPCRVEDVQSWCAHRFR